MHRLTKMKKKGKNLKIRKKNKEIRKAPNKRKCISQNLKKRKKRGKKGKCPRML